MNKRAWLICFIVSVIVLFGSFALPKSMGDTPAMIGGISMVLIVVFLIGFIVSAIRAKRKNVVDPAPTVAPTAQTKQTTAPAPTHTTSAPTHEPAPRTTTKTERIHVRGLEYFTNNIKAVASENPDYDLTKQELADQYSDGKVWQYTFNVNGALVPEPDNPVDPNAIMVQANGLCIGHVPKGSTAHIRKLMESGRIKSMSLDIGGGKYKEVYEDDDGTTQMDRDERPFSAVLELYLTEESQ